MLFWQEVGALKIVEVKNFMKQHVSKVQTAFFSIKQKIMTLEPQNFIPTENIY
jgi:hypothetical protein